MAKVTSTSVFNGGSMKSPMDFKNTHNAPRDAFHKTSKKPVTNTITTLMNETSPSVGDEDDASDDDSQGDDESSSDEPNGYALPGAQETLPKPGKSSLAGRKSSQNTSDDDMDSPAQDVPDDESQEDDYADLGDVSDGEDSTVDVGDSALLRFAEQDLIQEFEETEQRGSASLLFEGLTGMGLADNDDDDDEDIARSLNLHVDGRHHDTDDLCIDITEDPFVGMGTDDTMYKDMLNDAELAIWRRPMNDRKVSDSSVTAQKRVRFEDARSRASSESDSDDENTDFPDLFAPEDDPLLKQRLALATAQDDEMTSNNFHDNESVYDFDGDEEKYAFELDEHSSSDDDASSSDSEDDGDATDEETAEEQFANMVAMKKAMGRPASTPSTPTTAKKGPTKASGPAAGRTTVSTPSKGPTLGTFRLDPTRASMSANAAGTRIQVRPPITPSEKERGFWERAKTVNSSRHGSPQNSSYLTIASPTTRDETVPSRPFTAKSTLGSMFDGKIDIIRNNDVSGIAEDIYPAHMVYKESSFATSTTTEQSDAEEQDVDMADFIDLDFSASDNEEEPSMAGISSPQDSDVFSPFQSDADGTPKFGRGTLEHLSQCSNIVGSFRRNQTHARHVSSLASHPAQRASASEYNALQKGRRGAGNSPMTPARKSRANSDLSTPIGAGVKKNVNSPLAAVRPRSRGDSVAGPGKRAAIFEALNANAL